MDYGVPKGRLHGSKMKASVIATQGHSKFFNTASKALSSMKGSGKGVTKKGFNKKTC